MQQPIFYTAGCSDALHHAQNRLRQWGCQLAPVPGNHVTHLLLPVPSFGGDGKLMGGQALGEALRHLPENITIFGGNLPPLPYRCVDFLKDEFYLGENAQITAQCALQRLLERVELKEKKVLLIGWGRIAQRLLPLLLAQGAEVDVAVRREEVRRQIGMPSLLIGQWQPTQYQIIINTAPAPLLHQQETAAGAVLMDLASVQGILGPDVIWARGLPNKDAPEQSGTLIAKTALRYALGKEQI